MNERIENITMDKISSMSGGSITPTGHQETIRPPGTFTQAAQQAIAKQ
jgi:hypothetical protein